MMPARPLLQYIARERIAAGTLPRACPDTLWGGYGRGDLCSLCDQPIRSSEVEFEVPEGADAAGADLKFHITCHEAWQLECAPDDLGPGPNSGMRSEA